MTNAEAEAILEQLAHEWESALAGVRINLDAHIIDYSFLYFNQIGVTPTSLTASVNVTDRYFRIHLHKFMPGTNDPKHRSRVVELQDPDCCAKVFKIISDHFAGEVT